MIYDILAMFVIILIVLGMVYYCFKFINDDDEY